MSEETKKHTYLELGRRWELFVDQYLIASSRRITLELNQPERREIVLKMDQPWEGPGSGVYSVVFKDGDLYRMYYRASLPRLAGRRADEGCAYAQSSDGISWQRLENGPVRYEGRPTNLLLVGDAGHNFSPMLDQNPDCPKPLRYKAVAGHLPRVLSGYVSEDGLHWQKIRPEPLLEKGAFDSQNVVFFDSNLKKYVCYARYLARDEAGSSVRAIQRSVSNDFLDWSFPEPLEYPDDAPLEHFYTNAIVQCPGAEHLYLGFPMRFLPQRQKLADYAKEGVSDNVLISSRDGLNWEWTFLESWLRPGLDQRNWTQRNLIVTQGILETGNEFSLFVNENYDWESSYIRRLTIPRFRFASVRASRAGGVLLTKAFLFTGSRLVLNYATSAPGSIRVGLVDAAGWPLADYAAENCDVIYGDELEREVSWRGQSDLSFLTGQVISLKIEMIDADLYALQIR